MERNILGLPSLTGYTPLKAISEGQVLKYDFKGIGPIVIDKSGNGNRGKLMPRGDPPRRRIVSWLPLEMAIALDGEDDYVETPHDPSITFTEEDFDLEIIFTAHDLSNDPIPISKGVYNESGWYLVVFPDGKIRFRTNVEGTHDDLDSLSGTANPGERINLKIERRGDSATMAVNGSEVASGTLRDPAGNTLPLLLGTWPQEENWREEVEHALDGKIYRVALARK